jgi:hypothetical protein
MREKAVLPDHPDIARTLEHYSIVLRRLNRHKEAAETSARAVAIGKKWREMEIAGADLGKDATTE